MNKYKRKQIKLEILREDESFSHKNIKCDYIDI